jgi:hypothetical protein
MLALVLAVLSLLVLDVAALRRGADSRRLDPRRQSRSLP